MSAALPANQILMLALLYSVGAHGIMTLNDFKAIEGDQQLGVRSLPVQLGARRAAQVACAVMLLPHVKKTIDPAQPGVIGGNRDVLDFKFYFAIKANLENVDAKLTGVVLNKVESDAGPKYYQYHSYYYYGSEPEVK